MHSPFLSQPRLPNFPRIYLRFGGVAPLVRGFSAAVYSGVVGSRRS